MATDINIFNYSGKRYFMNISLCSVKQKDKSVSLANENIEKYECINEVNQLYMKGHFIYKDTTGVIDRFISDKYVLCQVNVGEVNNKSDGSFQIESVNDKYNHGFFIDGYEILSRDGNTIRYDIRIISTFYYNLVAVWDYSNYDKYANGKTETGLQIMKQCLKDYLMTPGKTFDDINTTVSMKYVTNGNDNLHSVMKYILNKEIYFDRRVESMKFLYYDNISSTVEIFDVSNMSSAKKMTEVNVSFFRQDIENLVSQDPVNFGSVVDTSNAEFFESNFSRTLYDYSFDTNEVSTVQIESDCIKNLYNKSMSNGMEKIFGINTGIYQPNSNKTRFNRSYAYWNNDMNLYDEQMDNFLKNNAYVLNCVGSVLRRPGELVNVAISKDIDSNMQGDDKKILDDLRERYSGFNGPWYCSKVKTMISPQMGIFRQNLYLFRNFKTEVNAGSVG